MQQYVSKELTHFAGANLNTPDEQYTLLLKILREGRLGPGEKYHGGNHWHYLDLDKAPASNEIFVVSMMVCFCDIPLADLEIHMNKYSRFGLSFYKRTLISKGVRPVLYFPKRDPQSSQFGYLPKFFRALRELANSTSNPSTNTGVSNLGKEVIMYASDLERDFVGYLKSFDVNTTDTDPNNYYMEREWRVLGQIRFELSDVCRIIIPADYASRLRADLPNYEGQIHFAEKVSYPIDRAFQNV